MGLQSHPPLPDNRNHALVNERSSVRIAKSASSIESEDSQIPLPRRPRQPTPWAPNPAPGAARCGRTEPAKKRRRRDVCLREDLSSFRTKANTLRAEMPRTLSQAWWAAERGKYGYRDFGRRRSKETLTRTTPKRKAKSPNHVTQLTLRKSGGGYILNAAASSRCHLVMELAERKLPSPADPLSSGLFLPAGLRYPHQPCQLISNTTGIPERKLP